MRSSFAPSIVAAALLAACDGTDPSNVPPIAAFTAECDGLECTLRDGSTDSDGSIHAYQWDFGDNTGTATSRDATHAYAEAGVFTVTLRVTDDDGGIASATEELLVAPVNRPPSARFTFACAALACDFSDGSSDIGGSIASYAWDFGDGGTSTDANPSHVYRLRGDYMVRLIVTDDGGATASASRQVALSQANLGPNANFAFSCDGLACDFADLSTDDEPGGSLTSHVWAFGDGGSSSEQNPGHAYAEAGTYTVTLHVTDDLANSATASREITVPGTTPGGLTADFTVGCVELECTFSDRSTGDVAVAWRWSFGDGTTSEEQHPTHAYDVTFPTRFTVALTVTGTDLDIRVARQEITVSPPLAGGVWRPRAPMPEARWNHGAAAAGGLLYAIAGSPTAPEIGFSAANERLTVE